MKLVFLPKTALGKWSLGLIILMPILFFIGSRLMDLLYEGVLSGDTILEDIAVRPALALTMIAGMLSGTLAFFFGIIAIVKLKERALLVYLAMIMGGLLIVFLLAHVVGNHSYG